MFVECEKSKIYRFHWMVDQNQIDCCWLVHYHRELVNYINLVNPRIWFWFIYWMS